MTKSKKLTENGKAYAALKYKGTDHKKSVSISSNGFVVEYYQKR